MNSIEIISPLILMRKYHQKRKKNQKHNIMMDLEFKNNLLQKFSLEILFMMKKVSQWINNIIKKNLKLIKILKFLQQYLTHKIKYFSKKETLSINPTTERIDCNFYE